MIPVYSPEHEFYHKQGESIFMRVLILDAQNRGMLRYFVPGTG
jgi:hypothetical protein